MIELIKNMNWTFISTIYTDGNDPIFLFNHSLKLFACFLHTHTFICCSFTFFTSILTNEHNFYLKQKTTILSLFLYYLSSFLNCLILFLLFYVICVCVCIIFNVYLIIINTTQSPGNYGSSLMEVFKNLAQEEGICIANTESVIHNAEDSKFDEIVKNLREYKTTAKVSYQLFYFIFIIIIFHWILVLIAFPLIIMFAMQKIYYLLFNLFNFQSLFSNIFSRLDSIWQFAIIPLLIAKVL